MDLDDCVVGFTKEKMQKVSEFRIRVNLLLSQKNEASLPLNQVVKFLHAAKFDLNKAEEIFKNYQSYRQQYGLSNLHAQKQLLNAEIRSKKLEILVGAKDAFGAQLLLYTANRHNPESCDVWTGMQLLFLILDQVSESFENQRKGITFMFDLRECSLSCFNDKYADKFFSVLQNGYPMYINMVYIIEAPVWFKTHKLLDSYRSMEKEGKIRLTTTSDISSMIPSSSLSTIFGASRTRTNSSSNAVTSSTVHKHQTPITPPPRLDRGIFLKQKSQLSLQNGNHHTTDDSQESLEEQPIPGSVSKMRDLFSNTNSSSPTHKPNPIPNPKPFPSSRNKHMNNGSHAKGPKPAPLPKTNGGNKMISGILMEHARFKAPMSPPTKTKPPISLKPMKKSKSQEFERYTIYKNEKSEPSKGNDTTEEKSFFKSKLFKGGDTCKVEKIDGDTLPDDTSTDRQPSKTSVFLKHLVSRGKNVSNDSQASNSVPMAMPQDKEEINSDEVTKDISKTSFRQSAVKLFNKAKESLEKRQDNVEVPLSSEESPRHPSTSDKKKPILGSQQSHPQTNSYENVSINPQKRPLGGVKPVGSNSSPTQKVPTPRAVPYKVTTISSNVPLTSSDVSTATVKNASEKKEKKVTTNSPLSSSVSRPEERKGTPPTGEDTVNKRQQKLDYENVFFNRGVTVEDEGELLNQETQFDEIVYENFGPDDGNKWMSSHDLEQYITKKRKTGLSSEYYKIKNEPLCGSADAFRLPANTSKNRYKDVVCYDKSRVVLTADSEGCDYIHANYVNGFEKERAFILTQGPLKRTVHDFWRMLWEKEVFVIVMTTKCVETGKLKCAQYWPDGESVVNFSNISVRVLHQDEHPTYVFRKFSAYYKGETRILMHYQFIAWPDYGVPTTGEAVLDLLYAAREMQENYREYVHEPDRFPVHGPPLVIHCSAGIGRSGTFCALDYCIDELRVQGRVNIQHCVRQLRQQRAFAIQTDEQYKFCYDTVLEYARYLTAVMKL